MVEKETYVRCGAFRDLNPEEQIAVTQLVAEGRAVKGTLDQIGARLTRTRILALLRVKTTDRIVGAATLKNPHPRYRAATFAAAAVPIAGYETASELGYVVIAGELQGKRLSGGLVDAIVREIREPAYATTDSNAMRGNLERSGFSRVGQEWQGQKGTLSLWTFVRRQGA